MSDKAWVGDVMGGCDTAEEGDLNWGTRNTGEVSKK